MLIYNQLTCQILFTASVFIMKQRGHFNVHFPNTTTTTTKQLDVATQ